MACINVLNDLGFHKLIFMAMITVLNVMKNIIFCVIYLYHPAKRITESWCIRAIKLSHFSWCKTCFNKYQVAGQ